MAIVYGKLEAILKKQNKTFYNFRKDKIVGSETIRKMQNNFGYIDTRTINSICKYLNCQPGDIMEYVPD